MKFYGELPSCLYLSKTKDSRSLAWPVRDEGHPKENTSVQAPLIHHETLPASCANSSSKTNSRDIRIDKQTEGMLQKYKLLCQVFLWYSDQSNHVVPEDLKGVRSQCKGKFGVQ